MADPALGGLDHLQAHSSFTFSDANNNLTESGQSSVGLGKKA